MHQMSQTCNEYILSLSCRDRVGVVSDVANLLSDAQAFITDISQYSDPETKWFFSRTVFDNREMDIGTEEFHARIKALAANLDMTYVLRPLEKKKRVLICVSQHDHCLNALLTKWQSNALPIDIVGVVSNHKKTEAICQFYQVPFYFLPITPETKHAKEQALKTLIDDRNIELLVLARYMQILSDDFCQWMAGKMINIHHSFLPGFKGAKPYHQAHARGVKIIGATAHYVTSDLDEGPIIAQEVKAIDHRVTVKEMIHIGHDIESTTLASAIKLHCEERVVMNGHRTVTL